MMKCIFYTVILTLGLPVSMSAYSQTLEVGAHVGALGGASGGSEIAYGVHLTSNPYSFAGFRIDATFANFTSGTYFSTSPAMIFYPVDFEEMKIGLVGGAGFHRFSGDKTRFALNYGVIGDFALSEMMTVGFDTRYHSLFDVEDLWNVFVTLGFRFELDGAW